MAGPAGTRRRRRRLGFPTVVRILYIGAFLVFLLVPFYWVVVTSIKPVDDYMVIPPVWFPDAPTFAEAGYPELTSGSWQGIFVPAGTAKPIVDRLYAAVIETMKAPDVQQRLANGGVEVVTSAPGEFTKFVAKETERWGKAVREAGATAE